MRRALLPALALLATACAPPEGEGWQMAIYMAADNTLDRAASRDLLELLDRKLPDWLTVDILIDRTEPGTYDIEPVDGVLPTGTTQRLRITAAEGLVNLGDWGELDSSSPDTLARFVDDIHEDAFAHRALVLWDHGSGWGFGSDSTNGQGLIGADDVVRSIRQGGLHAKRRFDLIGYDACFMSSVDVFQTVGAVADVFVGSAELEPGPGWAYSLLTRDLTREPPLNGEDLGRIIVDTYGEYYLEDSPKSAGGLAVTLAAWRTDPDAVAQAHADLASEMKTAVSNSTASAKSLYEDFAAAAADSWPYGAPDLGDSVRLVDAGPNLEDLAGSGTSVSSAAAALRQTLQDLRIAYAGEEARPGSLGISYALSPEVRPIFGENSPSAIIGRYIEGEDSLRGELAEGDDVPPTVVLAEDTANPSTPPFYSLSLEASDDVLLEEVDLILGRELDVGTFDLLLIAGRPARGKTNYTETYGLPVVRFVLAGGEDAPEEDQGILVRSPNDLLWSPVLVTTTDGDLAGTWAGALILDETLEPATLVVYEDDGATGTVGWEQVIEHGAQLAPLRFTWDPETSDLTPQVGRLRDVSTVSVDLVPIDSEGVDFVLAAEDSAGNTINTVLPVP